MKNKKILRSILILLGIVFVFATKTILFSDNKQVNNNITINIQLDENKSYYSKEDVALYLHTFKRLPKNYLTKNEAKKLGWIASKGNLWDVTDRGVIGGDVFSNREGKLPKNEKYFEADVNYRGGTRGAERLIYTREGKVIYYTGDHYKNFEVIYE
ncbi:ribonuclease domain-containing protein [Helcococcus bovis]|uniref:ribonuclease domain-containing protein n=1 Tax=Helcococcus bovis TaxID=3153252 RepID=UPI0038BD9335